MKAPADIGLIGLGTMGSALALNIADNGFTVAVHNRTIDKIDAFVQEAGPLAKHVVPAKSIEDLVASLQEPRAIILMVPAGEIVDDHIARLRPLLNPDDLIIDAGNANFRDTRRRALNSDAPYLGIGVSGGEDGARHGPSIMGGGDPAAWDQVAPILTAIAATHDNTPCATFMGTDGAGHFVKAVHNGIEYADMQMIAEVYGLLRDGMDRDATAIGEVFATWNTGALQSYLIEITAAVARAQDGRTGQPLLSIIEDTAGQKGTGRWTAIEAQHLASPVGVIEAAVAARNISAQKDLRQSGQDRFGPAPQPVQIDTQTLENALIAGKVICYAQGFEMLRAASANFDWDLPLPEIAKVWRAGCIIRSAMLDDMAQALENAPDTPLFLADHFAARLQATLPDLRKVVTAGLSAGHPLSALSQALVYFDAMRTARGTADMIQGQRDYFGWHGFARTDDTGRDHHGPWVDD